MKTRLISSIIMLLIVVIGIVIFTLIYWASMYFIGFTKQEKEYINTFKTGKCPTCGHDIDMEILEHRKEKMLEYAATYKKYDAQLKELESSHNAEIKIIQDRISELKHEINEIDSKVKIYLIPTNEELMIARETKALVE